MKEFANKIAIITGAASGLGRAISEALAAEGAIVVIADVNTAGAEAVATAINSKGGQASAAHLDVTDPEQVEGLIKQTVSKYQKLDYIFNNAGLGIAGEVRDFNLDQWRRVIDINLWGVIYGTISAYQVMIKQGHGHIVNIGSLAGLIGSPTMTPYAMTKYAVIGLSNSLRIEAADLGVKVTVVCPGFIQTGIFDSSIRVKTTSQELLSRIPFKILDANYAANLILRGVARNQAVITFPFYARLAWWLSRINMAFASLIHRRTVRDFRTTRGQS